MVTHVSVMPTDQHMELVLEAERCVVASLFDPPIGHSLADAGVNPEQFYLDAHRRIALVALSVRRSGSPVDPLSVCAALEAAHELEAVGGPIAVSVLGNYWTAEQNLAHRRTLVLDDWRRRERRRIAADIAQGKLEDEPAATALRDLASGHQSREPVPVGHVLMELFLARPSAYVPLGLSVLSGLHVTGGNLCVVAARPGVGKSAFLTSVALSASSHGWQTLFISLEMSGREIRQRLLAGRSGLTLSTVHEATDPELIPQATELGRLPLWIDADHTRSEQIRVDTLGALVERFARRAADAPGLVLVDYLQLVRPSGRYTNRVEQVGEVCRELKAAAMRSRLPMLCAAQLSRAVEQRQGGRPQLSDLRESGEIEQVADQVLLIHREEEHVFLKVAKNRHGPCFKCECAYRGPQCLFVDSAIGWSDEGEF